ncbi:monogalactosyldiacylglycerol (mgdg) synthase [Lucifera butyrica]|uniref:Monogalactosyldiacylglycerol (Mgdg) synthase n=1 Tax=Lucifera butyrica TaxID=1351585 RepID=A0A498R9Q5_9FIRM|nr:glycosyltransferase [Lucifera butyrica]VBB08111.1 monogalactosyldiacylglycerol (mgdg) synthase [Lucifera butyrica]
MTKPDRVLILSAAVGSGHIRAARAVGAALKRQGNLEVQYADIFDFLNPLLGQGIIKIYLKILQMTPGLYGQMYRWGNRNELALAGRNWLSRYWASGLEQYLHNFKPAAIVCTHAAPAGLAAGLSGRGRITIPVFAVVTDFVVHRLWIYPEVERYFLADETLRTYFSERGIPAERSLITGIPVSEEFSVRLDRSTILQDLNLEKAKKTILIMGGGAGIFPMEELVKTCDGLAVPLQIIVVTGNNRHMYSKLCNLKTSLRSTLHVFSYVDSIHKLMAVADVIISKPGGMTSAEALCIGLPMIIFRPIPGQEEGNAQFLLDKKVAVRANHCDELGNIVLTLLQEQSQQLELMRNRVKELARPAAADEIAGHIIRTIYN